MTHPEITADRDTWCRNHYNGWTDREIADQAFYVDAEIIEGDSFDTWEGRYDERERLAKIVRAASYELDRRERTGQSDMTGEPTLEQRLEPFGIEWQIEQRERAGLAA